VLPRGYLGAFLANILPLIHNLITRSVKEKWDGFGPALSVAVSGPGEIFLQNPDVLRFHIALRG
jgi:hypothetical protein